MAYSPELDDREHTCGGARLICPEVFFISVTA